MKYLKLNLDFLKFIPIILIPVSAIIGAAVLEFMVILSSAISLFFLKKTKKFYFNKYVILSIIFYVLIVLSSFNSYNFDYSIKTSVTYFRFYLYSFYIYFILIMYPEILKYFFYIIFVIFLVLVFDSFYQLIYEKNIIGLAPYNKTRITSFFGHEIILGSYLVKIFPILLALLIFFFKDQKKKIFSVISISILTIVVIFLSLERSSLFLMTLFLFIVITLSNIKIYKKLLFFLAIFTLFAVIYLNLNEIKKNRLSSLWDYKNKNIISFISKDNIYRENLENFIIDKKYSYMWASGIKMFYSNFTLGIGPKNFRNLCHNEKYGYPLKDHYKNYYSCSTHPHNFLIQLLAETGILGVLCYLFFLFFLIYDLVRVYIGQNYKNKIILVILLSSIIVNFFPLTTTGNFFNNWLSAMMYFPLGFYFYFKNFFKNE